jgi:hypothetical protein
MEMQPKQPIHPIYPVLWKLLNDAPFEILVHVAETNSSTWYQLSLLHKEFGLYSIKPLVRQNAIKKFGLTEVKTETVHYFLKNNKRDGWCTYEIISDVEGKKHHLKSTVPYQNGVIDGLYSFYFDHQLVYRVLFTNGQKCETFSSHMDYTRKRICGVFMQSWIFHLEFSCNVDKSSDFLKRLE